MNKTWTNASVADFVYPVIDPDFCHTLCKVKLSKGKVSLEIYNVKFFIFGLKIGKEGSFWHTRTSCKFEPKIQTFVKGVPKLLYL